MSRSNRVQICGLPLGEGVQAYKKEGPKFMQRAWSPSRRPGSNTHDRGGKNIAFIPSTTGSLPYGQRGPGQTY